MFSALYSRLAARGDHAASGNAPVVPSWTLQLGWLELLQNLAMIKL